MKRKLLITTGVVTGLCSLSCIACMVFGYLYGSTPEYKSTATAQAVARITEAAKPTSTPQSTITPKPTSTLEPTRTRIPPSSTPAPTPTYSSPFKVGERVKLTGGKDTDMGKLGVLGGITVWYMYEDACEIDVAFAFVKSGTEAFIASTKVCYAQDYDGTRYSHYYKVKIPTLDYSVKEGWVEAQYVTKP